MGRIAKLCFLALWLGLAASAFYGNGEWRIPTVGNLLKPGLVARCSPALFTEVCECVAERMAREKRWRDLRTWQPSAARGLEPWMVEHLEACGRSTPPGKWPPMVLQTSKERCEAERSAASCACLASAVEARVHWVDTLRLGMQGKEGLDPLRVARLSAEEAQAVRLRCGPAPTEAREQRPGKATPQP